MKRLFTLFAALLLATATLHAAEEEITLHTPTGDIHGKLMFPDDSTLPCPVVLIIAGSGPTDMNGNSIGTTMTNNSLLYLAQELAAAGIATVRYDKRGIGKSSAAGSKEEDLRFDHYIDDAAAWTNMLGTDARFNKVVIAGHSEGSLIGMVAAKRSKAVKAYVSIAGCGSPAYEILEKQLQSQPMQIQQESAAICKELRDAPWRRFPSISRRSTAQASSPTSSHGSPTTPPWRLPSLTSPCSFCRATRIFRWVLTRPTSCTRHSPHHPYI